MSYKDQVDLNSVPKHIAIIMDGNGRWAKERGEHRIFGHTSGVESVREALTAAGEVGVKYLTLYAFSTENWNRPQQEVNALMDLLVSTISSEIESLNKNNVKLHAIGDLDNLPSNCQAELQQAIANTATNDGVNLILALSYSSKWELTSAIRKIADDVASEKIASDEINDALISSYLSTAKFPDPELLIRTSGEHRISNFLLWQIAYSELHFTDTLWPDFKKENFYQAIVDYQARERRFGKTSEQLIKQQNA
jgi:undecaprenyl diphosphate synthase